MNIDISDIKVGKRLRELDRERVSGLANSIKEIGLLNPITVTSYKDKYALVAGLHRLEAYKLLSKKSIPATVVDLDDLHTELAQIDENLSRNDLSALDQSLHVARRKEIYEALYPETKPVNVKGGPGRGNKTTENFSAVLTFAQETAAKTGQTDRTVRTQAQIGRELADYAEDLRGTDIADNQSELLKIARMDDDTKKFVVGKIVDGGAKSTTDAMRQYKRETNVAPPPIKGKYRVWYADPPWAYNDSGIIGDDNYGRAERHYSTMSIDDLKEMGGDIQGACESEAVLFLWTTSPLLEDSFQVIKAWGFKYKTSFIWDKVKHNMGHYNSVRHEFLLVCTRGSCAPDNVKLFDSVQSIERTDKHSEKPEEFRNIIDTLYTRGNKIELFARAKADGWEVWGNEVESS